MGADPIALPLLEFLKNSQKEAFSLCGIFSQPDKPVGRGQQIKANPISEWAKTNGIPLLTPEKIGDAELTWLRTQEIDLIIVMAYGHLLKQPLLDIPPLGAINFHVSLLPKYRGASPIATVIAEGESETGVSLMKIVLKMDAGGVLAQEKVLISPSETTETLSKKLSLATVTLAQKYLSEVLSGNGTFSEQDDSQASYCRIIHKEDGGLDFSAPANVLERRIRALQPWPGAFFDCNEVRIKIKEAFVMQSVTSTTPGEVVKGANNALCVATQEGTLCFTKLQRPGGKMLDAESFLRGFPIPPGEKLMGFPLKPLVR
ncbi:MAG: methionyl-tRNA formyltransferase [Verrucomicrobia bacterium GWC2_42_7]|nr:MAG: methionyl-tRNA formyltransferase [Verrucomicrobia bacterium GWC2_42_7]